MQRTIIKINDEKCNGCGLCVSACHEGAIGLAGGKAKLLRDDYCDGLGNCLPVCPTGAIAFEERDAAAFDEAATPTKAKQSPLACGCPGTQSRTLVREEHTAVPAQAATPESRLRQWPVQIKLVPVNAPYFSRANLLVAADCTAYAYGDFHNAFIKNRVALIGCPKLDEGDYSEKLTAILTENDVKSITVVRMEVPCCGGLENAVKTAMTHAGKMIPWRVVTISTDGRVLDD